MSSHVSRVSRLKETYPGGWGGLPPKKLRIVQRCEETTLNASGILGGQAPQTPRVFVLIPRIMQRGSQGRDFAGGQHAKSRNGWTLVELLIVISLSMMMMGIVSTFLRMIFESSAGARRDVNLQTSVARLSDAFRADVHSAVQATMQDGALQLTTSSGAIIHYQQTDRGVKREVTHVDGQSRRDGFWLPAAWQVGWDVPTSSGPPLIGIAIEPSDTRAAVEKSAFGPLVIRAALAGGRMRSNGSIP